MGMNAIFDRRSIRKYEDKPVPAELIEKLLRAGMAAPSAGNERPWQFVVVDEKSILAKLADTHPYGKMMAVCPVAFIVCADMSLNKFDCHYWALDCSAATENILICATHLGLGAVWLGVYPREERMGKIKEVLELPENVIPFAAVPLGYPAENPAPKDRFEPGRVHRNKWQSVR